WPSGPATCSPPTRTASGRNRPEVVDFGISPAIVGLSTGPDRERPFVPSPTKGGPHVHGRYRALWSTRGSRQCATVHHRVAGLRPRTGPGLPRALPVAIGRARARP